MHIIDRSFARHLLAAALVAGMVFGPGVANVAGTHAAQSPTLHVRPDAVAYVDTYFTKLAQQHQFSGAVLLARDGTVLLSKGYGMADAAGQTHDSSNTEFIIPHLGLMEFAPAALLQLEDAGKLHEGDRICAYLAKCPAGWAPITVRELLSYSGGIHDYHNDDSFLGQGESVSLDQLVTQIGAFPLDYKPGTKCCTGGTEQGAPVEADLVQRISGESFGSYLESHFLRPLGLAHTGYILHTATSLRQLAVGYQSWQVPATGTDFSSWGGVIYSTLSDFYRWQEALLTGRVLSAASTAMLNSPAFPVCRARCGAWSSESVSEGFWVGTWNGVPVVYNDGYDVAHRLCRKSRLLSLVKDRGDIHQQSLWLQVVPDHRAGAVSLQLEHPHVAARCPRGQRAGS